MRTKSIPDTLIPNWVYQRKIKFVFVAENKEFFVIFTKTRAFCEKFVVFSHEYEMFFSSEGFQFKS